RPVAAPARHRVTRRADARPLLLAERRPRRHVDEATVFRLRLGEDRRGHRRVEDAAELGALTLEAASLLRLEPDVVPPARNGLDLPAEGRDPPAVDHVWRDDGQVDDPVDRGVQGPDRPRSIRVVELPVVLVAL